MRILITAAKGKVRSTAETPRCAATPSFFCPCRGHELKNPLSMRTVPNGDSRVALRLEATATCIS